MIETTIVFSIIGLIALFCGAIWKLAAHLRKIEKEITNDTHHDLMRIEDKLDAIGERLIKVEEDIKQCPLKR